MLQLYDYFRSTASYRVRIALHLKRLAYDKVEIHLVNNGGEQHQPSYLALNPQGLVPCLIDGDSKITQSLAILEYLEETYPTPALLPTDNKARAYVRALSQLIACDIHPLNNLRVLQYLTGELDCSEQQKQAWYQHWIAIGFTAFEQSLQQHGYHGSCCYGDAPTFADLLLVPQVYNANRFQCDLSAYPTIQAINAYCLSLPAFANAAV